MSLVSTVMLQGSKAQGVRLFVLSFLNFTSLMHSFDVSNRIGRGIHGVHGTANYIS